MDRVILHSDLNAFFASVETVLNPDYRGLPIAVCGETENRHGIVLAKSEEAKRYGIKTGMVNARAFELCPELTIVHPHYDSYHIFSELTREIYYEYTDLVEPFGMDECWLDVSGSVGIFGSGEKIAEEIRAKVKERLGLTVSIGVSFNKAFAKLGSDMKKPDAVTVISRENFREKVWPLPISDLLYIGPATARTLNRMGIFTLGELAHTDLSLIESRLGKNAVMIHRFACGTDESRVMQKDYRPTLKSIGHGVTCTADLQSPDEVWQILLSLSQDVGHRLMKNSLAGCSVELTVKDSELISRQLGGPLPFPTQSAYLIAKAAKELFDKNYLWTKKVRALTVRATRLVPEDCPVQTDIFSDPIADERRRKRDRAVEDIRNTFGKDSLRPASIMNIAKYPSRPTQTLLPGMMFR